MKLIVTPKKWNFKFSRILISWDFQKKYFCGRPHQIYFRNPVRRKQSYIFFWPQNWILNSLPISSQYWNVIFLNDCIFDSSNNPTTEISLSLTTSSSKFVNLLNHRHPRSFVCISSILRVFIFPADLDMDSTSLVYMRSVMWRLSRWSVSSWENAFATPAYSFSRMRHFKFVSFASLPVNRWNLQ